MSEITEIDDSSFEEKVFQNQKPVLVDFSANWCGPCKMLAPALAELAKEMPNVDFFRVDIDSSRDYAAKFGVRNIPTLLLFKGNDLVAKQVGALTKSQLEKFVTQAL